MDTVADYTAEVSTVARGKIKSYVQTAGEVAEDVASSVAETGIDAIKNLHATTSAIPENIVDAARWGTARLEHNMNDGQSRDQLLLGVAGVAIAVALGIAYQRRLSDESD